MYRRYLAALMLGLLLGACAEKQPPARETANFQQDMAGLALDYFALRPEVEYLYRVPAASPADRLLSHYDPDSEQARRQGARQMLNKINSYPLQALSQRQKFSVQLIQTNIGNALAPGQLVDYGSVLMEYGNWFVPYAVSHLSGPHVAVPTILEDNFPISVRADAEGYLARLQEYAAVLDGLVSKLKYDQQQGVIPPNFVLQRTVDNLEQVLALELAETPLLASFNSKLDSADLVEDKGLRERALGIMAAEVNPATARLRDALLALIPQADADPGVWRLPEGDSFYQAMITHFTDTTLSAEEIHQLGLAEVARIHGEMDVLLRQIGRSEGTVGERMAQMLVDPRYTYANSEAGKQQLLADLQSDLDLVDALLPQWFGVLPDQQVAIKAVPPHRERAVSGAFYLAPSQDGTVPGTFWISLYDVSANPSYTLQTLTYHEANPGHHLQTVLGMSDELPLLNTIFYSNAAGEGWGLYAERLAAEMGIYQSDPVDDIGRLQAELHRAVRLVVDTGMHAKRWTREQAIEYVVLTEGNHISDATAEVERYAVWPGQALGYKIGELKIIELRERARTQLGAQFDIRAFHDRVLEDGSLPLNVLEQKIDAWIAAQ
ncbi:MAG: DUF885 domain-containing protein [Halieaceae bacterium]